MIESCSIFNLIFIVSHSKFMGLISHQPQLFVSLQLINCNYHRGPLKVVPHDGKLFFLNESWKALAARGFCGLVLLNRHELY